MKEKAQALKKELKAKGYNLKDFSIRTNAYEMRIKIKNVEINKTTIEEIARKYEHVDYDERLGEILAGGNEFVFVEYDVDFSTIYEQYKNKAIELLETIEQEIATHGSWGTYIQDGFLLMKSNDFEYRIINENEQDYMKKTLFLQATKNYTQALSKALYAIEKYNNMHHFN